MMNQLKVSIEKHFSRAAVCYQEQGALQKEIAQRLADKLFGKPRRILELGCGTGFLTSLLLEKFPESEIHALDISPVMIERACSRIQSKNISFVAEDVHTFEPLSYLPEGERYDLIVSSSAIQWMCPFDVLFKRLGSWLSPKGILAFSVMAKGTLKELHEIRSEVVPDKPPYEQLPSFRSILEHLRQQSFRFYSKDIETHQVFYENATEFFRQIKKLGFTGGLYSAGTKPLSRSELSDLVSLYDERFSVLNAQVPATFVVGYVQCGLARASMQES